MLLIILLFEGKQGRYFSAFHIGRTWAFHISGSWTWAFHFSRSWTFHKGNSRALQSVRQKVFLCRIWVRNCNAKVQSSKCEFPPGKHHRTQDALTVVNVRCLPHGAGRQGTSYSSLWKVLWTMLLWDFPRMMSAYDSFFGTNVFILCWDLNLIKPFLNV